MIFQRQAVGPPRSFPLLFLSTATVPKRPAAALQLSYFCLQIQASGAAAAGRFGPEGREQMAGKKRNDREGLTAPFQILILLDLR